MNQSRNILKALILVAFFFFEASGKLRQRILEEQCQDLAIGISADEYDFYSFSENTRCLLAGGKYCTATTRPSQETAGYFKYVSLGCCLDWNSNYFDYVKYVGPLTIEECEANCISAMDQLGNPLRGLNRGSNDEKSDCYCYFDDGVILNVPDGGTSANDGNTGIGEVKTATDYWSCSFTGECYRYLSRECPSSTNPTADDTLTLVGTGCCVSFEDQYYDFVYYADKLTVDECESKCISAMNEINSPLQGIQRGSTEDKSNCYCLFDDGVLTSVPNCASAVRDDLSGVGEVKSSSTYWTCYATDGECYRYQSTKRALESKSNESSENFVTTCMSKECDAAQEFFINGTMVDANATLKDVNCMVSSCKTFEIGINHPYNDIVQVPSTDPSDCCDACHKETGCMLFSWSKNQSLCYLKDSQSSAADDEDFVTGYI